MKPTVSDAATELFASLGPWADADGESTSWALLLLCDSVAKGWQPIEDIIRDSDSGPGWSAILDADRAPAEWLTWLGQLVGQKPDDSISVEQQRAELKDAAGWKRGTRLSLETAVKRVLTGTKWSKVVERTTSAYTAEILTRYDESPTLAEILAAANTQKPAGIVLSHSFALEADEVWGWSEDLTTHVYACHVPGPALFPSEDLYPC